MSAATAHNIPVANVPGANVQAVVEYCVGSFLLLARRFASMNAMLRSSGWSEARALSAGTSELAGKTLGVVGVGAIGARLARLCKEGFGMRVIGSQPERHLIPDYVEPRELEELLAESDFVSLHCPLVPATRHLINEARLKIMKRGAFLVNASRGAVVDDLALAQALEDRTIAGAAIDVFAEQPLPRNHPFLKLTNINLTPHAAALTDESSENMSVGAATQIMQLLSGQRPEYLVNPEVWENYMNWRSALSAGGLLRAQAS
jgi:D-3-phosphoglycerate dehydrogenase